LGQESFALGDEDDQYGDTSNFDGEDSEDGLSARARDMARRTQDAFADAGENVSAASGSAADRAREFGAKARDAGRRAQDRAKTVVDEQPLTLALAGLALGALIGAVVRSTPQERELMGEASDRVKAQARQKLREGVDEAQDVAGRTLETVREEVNARAET